MTFAAQRNNKQIVSLCSHPSQSMTNDVMRIICLIATRHAFLRFYPARVYGHLFPLWFLAPEILSRRIGINGKGDYLIFLWSVLLLVGRQHKIFCALFQYAGGGLFSWYDVAFAVYRAYFFRR